MSSTETINLMSSANVSQTTAAAKIQSGVYNQAQINITSGTVIYNNQNYAAAIEYGTITATMQQNTSQRISRDGGNHRPTNICHQFGQLELATVHNQRNELSSTSRGLCHRL